MLNDSWKRAALGLIAVAAVACSPGKPAQDAITAAEEALAAAPADAQTYVAAEYQKATDRIAAAKAALEEKDYTTALASAKEASTTIGAFPAAIETTKKEATTSWKMMTDSLPGMVTAVEKRVNELSRMSRLPTGVTRANVDGAKKTLAEVKTMWGEATTSAQAGNVMDAVKKGTTCRTKTREMMTALRMR
jgi:hypothetical protein